jgi:flagella basal body P-ring formation protein FlgA
LSIVAWLASCGAAPESSSSTSSTPAASSSSPGSTASPTPSAEELHLRKAEQAVVRFWRVIDRLSADPESDLTRLTTVARGSVAAQWARNTNQYRFDQVKAEGRVAVRDVTARESKDENFYKVTACIDASNTNLVDKSGKTRALADRAVPPGPGGLLGVWAYTSVTTAQEVVAVRSTVPRGALIDREDLVTVRIGVDPALNPIPAAQLDGVVGRRAAMDLPAGGLVTQGSITATVVPARDMSVVGVAVPAALLPGEPLRAGDQVRVVATPGQQGEVTDDEQRSITAMVVGVYPDADSGQTVVSVQVPYDQAAELAARAATGKVAVVLDSRER